MTALVIGSTTPDFEYFIRMRNLSSYSHTWSGLFWYDLPLAFALTFIYHLFVRDNLIDNLPRMLRKRLVKFKGLNWPEYVKRHYLQVIICLIIGIATHIAWDGFTHRTGYFVSMLPSLKKNTEVFGTNHARFYILQNISSATGLLLVLIAIFRIPKDESVQKRGIFKYWLVAGSIAITITAARVFLGFRYSLPAVFNKLFTERFYAGFFNHDRAEDVIMTAISACLISLILTPFIVKSRV